MNSAASFKTPYFAVIFSSQRTGTDQIGYEETAERMIALAKEQTGFLGVEGVRGSDGFGITISYWQSEDDIKAWKINGEHLKAQNLGHSRWYKSYVTRVCKVERHYGSKDDE